MDNLCYMHVSLLDYDSCKKLTAPSKRGLQRLAGVDINKSRTIAVMESVQALAIKPGGYTLKEVSSLVKERLDKKQARGYTTAKAAYDVRKLRGKGLLEKVEKSRRYKTTKKGIGTIVTVLALTQKIIPTVLSSINKYVVSEDPVEMQNIDSMYLNIRNEIKKINQLYGVKTVA